MSEFDELVAADGVLMAGLSGPDGRVAEHKADAWYIQNPAAEIAHWLCVAITTMFGSTDYAVDRARCSGFDQLAARGGLSLNRRRLRDCRTR